MATRRVQKHQAELAADDITSPTSDLPQDWRHASSRNERGKMIREALFKAAAEVVGEHGYQEASISMITQRAGVAQGTFYNHFQSRQDILDQLLPALGREMMEHIAKCSKKRQDSTGERGGWIQGVFLLLKAEP